jgi:hypothetical protein
MIAGRNPHPSKWAGEFLLADLYVPLWLCLIIGGVGLLIHWGVSLDQEPLHWPSIVASAAALGATILCLKFLRVGEKLAAFASQAAVQASGAVVKPFEPIHPQPEKPAPQPVHRKAA